MADFGGFDLEAWRDYVALRRDNSRLIAKVEKDVETFIDAVKRRVHKAVVEKRPPFAEFEGSFRGRGDKSQFWFCPKAVAGQESHWGMVKAELEEGWIETSVGTWTTRHCPAFLRAVGKQEKIWESAGWKLWYATGGVQDYTDVSSWNRLLDMKVTEISLLRLRELSTDGQTLSSVGVVDKTFEALTEACGFLVQVLK